MDHIIVSTFFSLRVSFIYLIKAKLFVAVCFFPFFQRLTIGGRGVQGGGGREVVTFCRYERGKPFVLGHYWAKTLALQSLVLVEFIGQMMGKKGVS